MKRFAWSPPCVAAVFALLCGLTDPVAHAATPESSTAPAPGGDRTITLEAEACDPGGTMDTVELNKRAWASGEAVLDLKAGLEGQDATLQFEIPSAGSYQFSVIAVSGKGLNVQVLIDGEPLGQPILLKKGAPGQIGVRELSRGRHELTFRSLGEGNVWIDTIELVKL